MQKCIQICAIALDGRWDISGDRGYDVERNGGIPSNMNVLFNVIDKALYSKYIQSLLFSTQLCIFLGTTFALQSPPQGLKTPRNYFRALLLSFVAIVGELVDE